MKCWTCNHAAQAGHVLCQECEMGGVIRRQRAKEQLQEAIRYAENVEKEGAL